MRLKEIKPGMAIHCTEIEQLNHLKEHGIAGEWIPNYSLPIFIAINEKPFLNIYVNEFLDCGISGKEYCERNGYKCVEFSDLILPKLSADEVLKTLEEICHENFTCTNCPLKKDKLCNIGKFSDSVEILEICAEWKSNHEKKKPEIETVDICRIIEVLPDRKRCVHEETLSGVYGSTKEEEAKEILKQYILEHEGNYIAVVEHVCRVKAVE